MAEEIPVEAPVEAPVNSFFISGMTPVLQRPAPIYDPDANQTFGKNLYDSLYMLPSANLLRNVYSGQILNKFDSVVGPEDRNYDLINFLTADPRRIEYSHMFSNTANIEEANDIWETIQLNTAARERIAKNESYLAGFVADFAEPIYYLPGVRLLKGGGGAVKGMIRGLGYGLPSVLVAEGVRLSFDPTSTLDEAATNTIIGAGMFSAFGAATGYFRGTRPVTAIASDIVNDARLLTGENVINESGSRTRITIDGVDQFLINGRQVTAEQYANPNFAPDVDVNVIPPTPPAILTSTAQGVTTATKRFVAPLNSDAVPRGFAAETWYAKTAKFFASKQSPYARVSSSDVQAYEDLMDRLAGDYGIEKARNKLGIASEDSAYLASKKHQSAAVDLIMDLRNEHANYLTGSTERSSDAFGINIVSTANRAKDFVLSRTGRTRLDGKITTQQFDAEVLRAYWGAQRTGSITHPIPEVKRAAEKISAYFENMRLLGQESGVLPTVENKAAFLLEFSQKFKANQRLIDALDKVANKTPKQLAELNQLRFLNSVLKNETDSLKPIKGEVIEYKPYYFTHLWRPELILGNEGKLEDIFYNWFSSTLRTFDPATIRGRAKLAVESIMEHGEAFDTNTPPPIGAGRAYFAKKRLIEIPTELIQEFIETDLNAVAKYYAHRMGIGAEYMKAFGSADAEISIAEASLQAIRSRPDNESLKEIMKFVSDNESDIRLVRDYNMGRLHQSSQIGKEEAKILRGWFVFSSMGKVALASMPETARSMMVLGFKENFEVAFKALGDMARAGRALKEIRGETTYYAEMAQGDMYRRIVDSGIESFGGLTGKYNAALKRIERPISWAQTPYYLANALTMVTYFQKSHVGLVASAVVSKRVLKVGAGTANANDLRFLASYGISKDEALLMAKEPIEKDGGVIFANTRQWANKELGKKFYRTVDAIINRTITTAGPSDKPAIAMGVIGKGLDRKEISALSLPFQLKTWVLAANNKVLFSALQGRDANVKSGMLMMVGIAYYVQSLKMPDAVWDKMSIEEKIANAVDASGVLAMISDLNFAAEQASTFMGYPIGLRPALGVKPKFGDPDFADAISYGTGPAIQKLTDTWLALNNGTDREQANAIVNALPFQNLFWISESWRKLAKKKLEEIL